MPLVNNSVAVYTPPMKIITDTADLAEICTQFAKHDFVTVDTEFLRETTFWPILCLIQIAGPDDECIVDPMAEGIDLAPFFELMADTNVVKVFHAARQDIEIIHNLGGLIPSLCDRLFTDVTTPCGRSSASSFSSAELPAWMSAVTRGSGATVLSQATLTFILAILSSTCSSC